MCARKLRNLGQTSLRGKRRSTNGMHGFDRLPADLRNWLAHAALPWSPTSARRIWLKSRSNGLTLEETLQILDQAEQRTLRRDRYSTKSEQNH